MCVAYVVHTLCVACTVELVSAPQDTLDSVEVLIKKHDDFAKTLDTQEERFVSLDQFAKTLIAVGHYDTLRISKRRDIVLQRCVCVCVCVGVWGVCVNEC